MAHNANLQCGMWLICPVAYAYISFCSYHSCKIIWAKKLLVKKMLSAKLPESLCTITRNFFLKKAKEKNAKQMQKMPLFANISFQIMQNNTKFKVLDYANNADPTALN